MQKPKLLPCPFCGSDNIYVEEYERQDKVKRDKIGRINSRAKISHFVQCSNCGASSGNDFEFSSIDGEVITAAMVNSSKYAAAMIWNARYPLNEDAIKLVNKIINDSFKQSHNENQRQNND